MPVCPGVLLFTAHGKRDGSVVHGEDAKAMILGQFVRDKSLYSCDKALLFGTNLFRDTFFVEKQVESLSPFYPHLLISVLRIKALCPQRFDVVSRHKRR